MKKNQGGRQLLVLSVCALLFWCTTFPVCLAGPQQPAENAQASPQAAPAEPQAAPAQQPPAQPAQQPPAQPPQQPPAQPAQQPGARISLHLENANLIQVIGIIAAEMKMNYIIDPGVKGVVNINTLGELRQEDLLPLLQAILRANGAAAVQSGGFWRIVPIKDAPRVPLPITQDPTGAALPADDRMVMNVIALRYVAAGDMSKIMSSYLSEAGHIVTHEPGNILLVTDTSRSLKRLMELVNIFDTETLAQQRLRLIPVENSQARDLVKDLQEIFRAYALSEKTSAVRFIAIDRMNSILAVASNPGVFQQVQEWVEKLDKPVRRTGMQNFVYKVENSSAENLAAVLSSLYGAARAARGPAGGAPGMTPFGGVGAGAAGGMPPMGAAPGMPGGQAPGGAPGRPAEVPAEVSIEPTPGGMFQAPVRIVPDTINNVLIIQATAQDYETLRPTLKEMDVLPRQVLIEAKVYEVTLSGALAFGVEAFLRQRTNVDRRPVGQFALGPAEGFGNPGLSGAAGLLVGRARELMVFLNAQENRGRTRVLSAPTVLASDNLAARIQVGAEIPILTSQGVAAGAQAGGSSIFTNTVQQRDTGVILSVTPRINSSGLVTLQIQQEVSSPQAPLAGAVIQSPSIQKRSIATQAIVQDGETIALGGIISESRVVSRNHVPLLGDIPGLGILFGSTSYSTARTELIVLLTPRVIQDLDGVRDATFEFRNKLRELRKLLREKGE